MESSPTKPVKIARFGVFEADFERHAFTKRGLRVRLQDQPFKLLELLLEHPGEIVSREEIQQRLWSADTFVEFDAGLNTAIKKLRAALEDSADSPRFIETVPRRGYRFLAPVAQVGNGYNAASVATLEDAPRRSPTPTANRRVRWKLWAIATALAVLCAAMLVPAWMARRAAAFKEADAILLADFANGTGEPVLDGSLHEAAAIELAQSPFLNLVSNDRVRETLRAMSRRPEDYVPAEIAREVCERVGARAYIAGAVARAGTGYLETMRAVNCVDETTFASEVARVANKEDLLPALDEMASKLRRDLGESLSSVRRFDVPIEEATTPSLEALKAYSLGMEQRARGDEKQSIPLFDHAIDLDPSFAMAYARRGAAYTNLGETERGGADIKAAFERRANLSEQEKLFLTMRYADADKGDTRKVIETCEVWHQLYPRELQPLNTLSGRYQIIGEYEKAEQAARVGLALRPDNYVPYANLAGSLEALNRLEEAKQVCIRASTVHRDSSHTHDTAFEIAYLQKDEITMQKEIDAAKGTPREGNMVWLQGLVLANAGKLRAGRTLLERSYAKRRENELDDFAAYAMATEAVVEADFGFASRAKKQALEAMKIGHGLDAEEAAGEALSLTGSDKEALLIVEDLRRRFPLHIPLNPASLPTILAAIQVRKGNPAKAVQILQEAVPYDFSEFAEMAPVYMRGQAYLQLGAGQEAAGEFQKILDHPGLNALFPRHPLALLGLARAHVLTHDTAKAKKEYEDFFARWVGADSDIPVWVQAKSEYKKLP